MALRIICPAYQPMEACSPFSLFGGTMRPYHPCMRKQRRRVVESTDFIDRIFDEMFVLQPSNEAKRDTKCCKQQGTSSSSNKETDSDTFTKQMMVLRGFKPEEIQIRVTEDKKVVMEGKQEMKKDEGEGFQSYQMREFKQTVDVPENVDIEQLTSSISQEGVLTISAPLLPLPRPEKDQKEEVKQFDVKIDKEVNDGSNQAKDNSESSKKDDSNMAEST